MIPETAADGEQQPMAEEETPHLSASFFAELVEMPSCKLTGKCDGCGRCEH